MQAKTRLNVAVFALFTLILTLGLKVAPVRAELSPDAGIATEAFQVQQAIDDQIAQDEAQKAKDAEEQKKADEKKKLDAKKKAAALEAKKKAQAEADAKAKAEAAANPKVEVKSELLAANLFGANVSMAQKDLPQGLTPVIMSEALSTNPGKAAAVTIKTLPGATCNIDVFVVTRTPVTWAGLENKTADENGECTWKWTVKPGTPRGSWGVRIIADKDGKTDDTWTTMNIGAVH